MTNEPEAAQVAAWREGPRERVLWYLGAQLFMCHYCMAPIAEKTATVDHVVPVANGGTINDGIVLACRRCNGTRGYAQYEAFIALIDGMRPPVLFKPRKSFPTHLGQGTGRQQIELTRIWQTRRALHREHKLALMPSAEILHARRMAFVEEMRALNSAPEFVEAAE
jgi:hypothetical protein